MNRAADRSSEKSDPAAPIALARSEAEKIRLTAELILTHFDDYYGESRQIPRLAQLAFENRDPAASLGMSRSRLSLYSQSVNQLGRRLAAAEEGLEGGQAGPEFPDQFGGIPV